MCAVAEGLMTAIRTGVSGAYVGLVWDSTNKDIYAWNYSFLGSVGLTLTASPLSISDEPTGFFNVHRARKSSHRIHSDSESLVSDGAIAFSYRTTSTTWRIIVWDLESGSPTSYSKLYTSCQGIGGPVYSGGWLWFVHLTSSTLSLRKIRADLTGEVTVRSESIGAASNYRDGSNSGWILLSSIRASTYKETAGSVDDVPYILRDGSLANMTPGFSGSALGTVEYASNGSPSPGGLSILVAGSDPTDLYSYDGAGSFTVLWPPSWDISLGLTPLPSSCLLTPGGDEAVVFPVVVGVTSGSLVRTRIDGSYAGSSPIPSMVPELSPTGGVFALLPRV